MKENKYTILYCVCENFCDSFYYCSGSSSGSGTVINYGSGSDFLARYGSGSASQKLRFRFHNAVRNTGIGRVQAIQKAVS